MTNFIWASPWFFGLFAILPLLIWWYWKQLEPNQPGLHISSSQAFEGIVPSARVKFRHLPFVLRILGLSSFFIALARPQSSTSWQNSTTEGIDIILSMDISPSMLAEDFKPNRLEAAKKVVLDFIDKRPDDRMGLVVFSGEAFTQVPITSDHAVIKNILDDVKSGLLTDGTAIGNGLALAVKRLLGSKAKSRVVILLTDGINNSGEIAPLTAGEIAKTFGIRVYTIGVGTYGTAPYPVQTPWGIQYQQMEVKIDEKLMKQIASMTNGQYFRATNNKNLKDVYNTIDKLEKSKIETTEFRKRKEEYLLFALIGLGFLLTELLIRNTWLRSIP